MLPTYLWVSSAAKTRVCDGLIGSNLFKRTDSDVLIWKKWPSFFSLSILAIEDKHKSWAEKCTCSHFFHQDCNFYDVSSFEIYSTTTSKWKKLHCLFNKLDLQPYLTNWPIFHSEIKSLGNLRGLMTQTNLWGSEFGVGKRRSFEQNYEKNVAVETSRPQVWPWEESCINVEKGQKWEAQWLSTNKSL